MARQLCFGRITSNIRKGIQLLSGLTPRVIAAAGSREWPYGSWIPFSRNQAGIDAGGVWARGLPTDPTAESVRDVGVGDARATLQPAQVGSHQVVVGAVSGSQWIESDTANDANNSRTARILLPGMIDALGNPLPLSLTSSGDDEFVTPISMAAVAVVPDGNPITAVVESGNGRREARAVGGNW